MALSCFDRTEASSRETPGAMSGSAGGRPENASAPVSATRARRGDEVMLDASSVALHRATLRLYIVAMPLIVELLHSDAQPPRRATEGSAGYDLCAYLRGRIVKCSDGQRSWEAPVAESGAECSFALERGIAALIP